jgi:hypothetical protein
MPSESVRLRIRPIAASAARPASRPAQVAGALRAVESFLLRGGQQTARRNAWAAVVADRQRARDRREAERVVAALTSGTGRAGADAVRD